MGEMWWSVSQNGVVRSTVVAITRSAILRFGTAHWRRVVRNAVPRFWSRKLRSDGDTRFCVTVAIVIIPALKRLRQRSTRAERKGDVVGNEVGCPAVERCLRAGQGMKRPT